MPVGHRLVTTCNKEMADKMCEIGELGRLVFSLIDQLTQVQEEREILARKFESVRKDVEVVKQESSRRIERLEQEIAWLRVELAEERTGKDRTEVPWRQAVGGSGRSDRAGSWRTPVNNQFASLRDEVGGVADSRGGKGSVASGRADRSSGGRGMGTGGEVGAEDGAGEMVGEGARRKVRGSAGGRKGRREGADGRKEVGKGADGRKVREGVDCRKEASGGAVEGKVVVVGDSQVRYLDRVFCDRDRKNRISVCLPGAGIGDVGDRVGRCLAGEGVKPIVCLSAGGNDIGRVRSEELYRKCQETLGRVRDLGGVPVMCGVLPRMGAGVRWLSYAIALNCRLAEHCKKNGWAFIDHWDLFFGKHELYTRDGIHLSKAGVEVFADTLERQVGLVKEFFQ